MRTLLTLALAAAALALTSGGLLADDKPACQLLQSASLDMTTEIDGEVSVPATVDGRTGLFLVDTGNIQSMIADTIASQLDLKVGVSPNMYMLMGGVPIFTLANTHTFDLGGLRARDMPLLIAPTNTLHNDTIGMLAPDIMSNYDVEFDFAAGKFNLFLPDHCPGAVIYWTRTAYAAVPIELDRSGHIMIDIMLDGKELTAAIDTGADRSTMPLSVFKSAFGRDISDPAMKAMGRVSINGTAMTTIYRFPFQAMTFEGVQVQNPNIDILAGERFEPGGPQLILGIETLRQLHMYIAYKEKKVYLTPAEAR